MIKLKFIPLLCLLWALSSTAVLANNGYDLSMSNFDCQAQFYGRENVAANLEAQGLMTYSLVAKSKTWNNTVSEFNPKAPGIKLEIFKRPMVVHASIDVLEVDTVTTTGPQPVTTIQRPTVKVFQRSYVYSASQPLPLSIKDFNGVEVATLKCNRIDKLAKNK